MSYKPILSNQTSPIQHVRWRGRIYALGGLLAVLIVVAVLAIAVGSVKIPLVTTGKILVSNLPFFHITPDWRSSVETIILEILFPTVRLISQGPEGIQDNPKHDIQ